MSAWTGAVVGAVAAYQESLDAQRRMTMARPPEIDAMLAAKPADRCSYCKGLRSGAHRSCPGCGAPT